MTKANISHSPGNGKKIDTLYYDVKQSEGKKLTTRKVEMVVYIQKKYGQTDTPPLPTVATQFLLVCEDFREVGPELDTLVKAMRGNLDSHYKIKWQPWFEVRVDPMRIFQGNGDGFQLSWTEVERGETLDGDILLKRYNTYGDFNNRWEIKPWPETYKDTKGKVLSCIPATDENEKALKLFAMKIAELRKVLADFVSPNEIAKTLDQITRGQLMLSATQPPKDRL